VPVFIRLKEVHRLSPIPLLATCHKGRWCITAINTVTKTHDLLNINFLLQKLMPRKSRILQTQSSILCSEQPAAWPCHEPGTSVHANPSSFLKTQFNITLSSTSTSSELSSSSGFPTNHCMHFTSPTCVLHFPPPLSQASPI